MALIDFYLPVKLAHVALVSASGVLFACRGAASLARRAWPLTARWRVASVVIDTALLVAGALLWAMLELNPLRDAWLGTKLLLLVLYIALGTLALKWADMVAFAAAIACYLFMVSVALAHHPLGALRTWFG
jgi:uncharacterized membrane protein SirB2